MSSHEEWLFTVPIIQRAALAVLAQMFKPKADAADILVLATSGAEAGDSGRSE